MSFLSSFEIELATLMEQMDTMDKLEWGRRWADLVSQVGWPCTGFPSWDAWYASAQAKVSTGNFSSET